MSANKKSSILSQLPESDDEDNPQKALAALASIGNQSALKQISEMIEPLVHFQTGCFCKRFCGSNANRYHCSLDHEVNRNESSSSLRSCNWGKQSHVWMYDYLTSKKRLLKFKNAHAETLSEYFFELANSLAFYQCWTDWRFGKQSVIEDKDVHLAIFQMGPEAYSVFKGLKQHKKTAFIAECNSLDNESVETISSEIIEYLAADDKLHLIHQSDQVTKTKSTEKTYSLKDVSHQEDVKNGGTTDKQKPNNDVDINQMWKNLTATEQFIMEAFFTNKQSASDVLYALQLLDIRIKEGVLPEDTTVSHLYAYRDEILTRLASTL